MLFGLEDFEKILISFSRPNLKSDVFFSRVCLLETLHSLKGHILKPCKFFFELKFKVIIAQLT